ncbi:MAG TPA: hypothetical protein VHL78_07600 [Actinomycetota bacterium]|nr:hypothetical protein [Actinomycetota bacterium]
MGRRGGRGGRPGIGELPWTATPAAPVLSFAGRQTAVGVTSKVLGRARVNVGGACPR